MSIRRARGWGHDSVGVPDVEIAGGDSELSAWLEQTEIDTPQVRLLEPQQSDLARCLGLVDVSDAGPAGRIPREVPLDLVALDDGRLSSNMIVIGTAPDRLRLTSPSFRATVAVDGRRLELPPITTLVIAVGQFLRGLDISPRGHPGDGKIEILAFAVRPSERAELRKRLAQGTHVPHPDITQRQCRELNVEFNRPVDMEIDGLDAEPRNRLSVRVRPDTYRLAN